jgi:pyruvate ferredoxin oxidoreductase gamma subunit
MIEVRWHGRGGQGSFTSSRLLGEAVALNEGKHALAFPSFGPERRGAPVLAFTKIDDEKIRDRSEVTKCDYIVVLDETLYNPSFMSDLKPGGFVILNTSHSVKYDESVKTIDATAIALKVLGKPITNTAMLGALTGFSGIVALDSIQKSMTHFFRGSLLEKNIEVVNYSYECSRKQIRK